MKGKLVGAVAILLGLLLVIDVGPSLYWKYIKRQSPPNFYTPQWLVYRDERYGFAFDYPADLTVTRSEDFSEPKRVDVVFSLGELERLRFTFLDSDLLGTYESMLRFLNTPDRVRYENDFVERVEVHGSPAIWWGSRGRSDTISVFVKDRKYSFTRSHYGRVGVLSEDEFRRVAESFKLSE